MNRTLIATMLLLSTSAIAEQSNPFFIRAFDGRFVCAQEETLVLCDGTQRTPFRTDGLTLQSPYGNVGEFAFEKLEGGKVYMKPSESTYMRANIISGMVDQVDAAQEWEKFKIVRGNAFDLAKFMARKYSHQMAKRFNESVLPKAQEKLDRLQAFWNSQTPMAKEVVQTAGMMVGMATFVILGLKYTWPSGK